MPLNIVVYSEVLIIFSVSKVQKKTQTYLAKQHICIQVGIIKAQSLQKAKILRKKMGEDSSELFNKNCISQRLMTDGRKNRITWFSHEWGPLASIVQLINSQLEKLVLMVRILERKSIHHERVYPGIKEWNSPG